MSVLVFDSVSRSYETPAGLVRALLPTTLRVDRGQRLAVVGPSGSGKSTLLNLAGALDVPTMGSVSIGGVSMVRPTRRQIRRVRSEIVGSIFQQFHLIPYLDATQNVILALRFRGLSRRECSDRALRALDRVGLRARAEHRPSELSRGQQQRVAIARALCTGSELILADEPTGNLDAETTFEILELLSEVSEEGTAVVVATHDSRVADWAESSLVLESG